MTTRLRYSTDGVVAGWYRIVSIGIDDDFLDPTLNTTKSSELPGKLPCSKLLRW